MKKFYSTIQSEYSVSVWEFAMFAKKLSVRSLVLVFFMLFFLIPGGGMSTGLNSSSQPIRMIVVLPGDPSIQGNSGEVQMGVLADLQKEGLVEEEGYLYQYVINGFSVFALEEDMERIAALPGVSAVFPDEQLELLLEESVPLIGAPQVWELFDDLGNPVRGQGVKVAVLDTGIDYLHPDLGGCFGPGCKVVGGYDFVDDDPDPMDEDLPVFPFYPGGHGTQVSGVVAANGGLTGVAPEASLVAYRVCKNQLCWLSEILAALDQAVIDEVDVLNMSFGSSHGSAGDLLSQATDAVVDHGIVAVAAAGNVSGYRTISSPSTSIKAISVGATTKQDEIAFFSSRGPVDGYLIKPDLLAPGVNIHTTVINYSYAVSSGTSFSSPHVAGAAALLKQMHPEWTPEMIKASLMNSAESLGMDPYAQGAGRLQVDRAAASTFLAYPGSVSFGRVDLGENPWVRNALLTVVNIGSADQNLSLAFAGDLGPGIAIQIDPSTLFLTPGESQAVELVVTVNTELLPYPPDEPYAFFGEIEISDGETERWVPVGLTPPLSTCELQSQIPASECYALEAIYTSTNGAYWSRKHNWLETPPCSWVGVVCEGGHATEFTLGRNNLSGMLPAAIGDLSQLRILSIFDNEIQGPLPDEIGSLASLEYLVIWGNRLSGRIPDEIGNLTNLQILVINSNQLSGPVPASIVNLTQLGETDIGLNMLYAIEPETIAFLNAKNPGWWLTQTVPPQGLSAEPVTQDSILLSWEPIAYTGGGGYYIIHYGSQAGGPYEFSATTIDKTDSEYLVEGLLPTQTYYFTIQTFTPWSYSQKNDLLSDFSEEISITPGVGVYFAEDGFNPGANNEVRVLAVQEDGKILVAGFFNELGGEPRPMIGRLLPDGSPDLAFSAEANSYILAMAVQPDGKILVGGVFTQLNGAQRRNIGRLNPDGSLDYSFNPGASNAVNALAVQPDGKILVGGGFTELGGQPREKIGRLNPDGSLDESFNPGASTWVYELEVLADGKILVGGSFSELDGQPRDNLGRLNPDGSLDLSFNPGANGAVVAFSQQADGKILVGGFFNELNGQPREGLGRLNPDGSLDPGFNPEPDSSVNILAVQADGKILVGGWFSELGGEPRNRIGRLHPDGSVDSTFNPGANGEVRAFVEQPDGKILVGGRFTELGGQPRENIGRLYQEGSLDSTFNPVSNGSVRALAVQPDGMIVAGGTFLEIGDQPRENIARFYPDGRLDPTFNPGLFGEVTTLVIQEDGRILVGGIFTTLGGQARANIGRLHPDGSLDEDFNPGANGQVLGLALQADGKLLVGGDFTELGGQPRQSIGRLNPDGTLDEGFAPGTTDQVLDLEVQPDGKILIVGSFSELGGQPHANIARLHPDGSLDETFNPGANGAIRSLAVQADGKIVVVGWFTQLNGQPRNWIGRFNPDGSLDTPFNPGASNPVFELAIQTDGKIIVGGSFTTLRGQPRERIARLKPDGSLDPTFNPGADNNILALAVQADGKIVLGGDFTELGGLPRFRIGRLPNDTLAVQTLIASGDGASVVWMRSGANPELSRVTFELSVEGGPYTLLGEGTRIPEGWRLDGLALPTGRNIFLRARGYVTGTGSLVESVRNAHLAQVQAPVITSPDSATFSAGVGEAFTVTAVGDPTPGLLLSGALPEGISFTDNGDGTGTLAGTPAAGTGGIYNLTFTASNGVPPDYVQTFTLTVIEMPQVIFQVFMPLTLLESR